MLNKCQFIGRLGGKPETRYTQSGTACTNFTVACSEKWKDKNTGQQQERTEWVRISAFGRLAEICDQYLDKGSLVYVEGKQQTREWEKDGVKRYTTEIVASEMKMLGSRGDNQGYNQQPQQQSQQSQDDGNGFDDFDEEIPF